MPKTAAQKAARRRRRQNRAVRSVTVPVMSRGRVSQIINSMGKGGKKRKRKRANAKSSSGHPGVMDYGTSDGLSKSTVIVNNSTIEDTFQLRREKVANVLGTTGLSAPNLQFFINPGNTILFPIFSQIAATYEEYRLKVLKFEYVTEAYTASGTNVSAGKVILATNFDPDDANFTTDTQAENYAGSVKGTAYSQMSHDVVAHGRKRHKGGMRDFSCNNYFVSSSANVLSPVTGAAKFYDVGNFQLITNGNASTAEIGELYVTYQFVMIRPKQQTPIGQNALTAHYNGSGGTTANNFLNVAVQSGSTMLSTIGTNTFTMTALGRFLFVVSVNTATSSTGGFIISAGTGATLVSIVADDTAAQLRAGSASTNQIMYGVVDVTAAPATMTLTASTIVGACLTDIFIVQIPGGITVDSKRLEKEVDNKLDLLLAVSSARDERVELLQEQLALMSKKLALLSPCESPIEQKEADLERSVHISTREAKKFGLFGK